MSDEEDNSNSEESRDQVDLLAEEFSKRLLSGEAPSIEAYASRFPDLADQIRAVFPALQIMAQVRSETKDGGEIYKQYFPEKTEIGDYTIIRKIGQGGMGVVYEAQQKSLGRRVALKLLPFNVSQSEKFVERFRREARAAAKLHHTNIVPVFDVGQDGETLFYAMQFIEGQGLDDVQKEITKIKSESKANVLDSASRLISGSNTLSGNSASGRSEFFKKVARLGVSVGDALSYSHQRSMIHRDVKPSNLLLDTDGVVWLTDFGLVKTAESELTETGDFVGTARYMSPERFKGTCDHRADIYGLGMTLYELVTGSHAFHAKDRLHLVDQIATHEPVRPRDIDRNIPLDLETIILKAMEKDPRRRYQSAEDLAQDLARFVDDQPIRARRASLLERSVRWVRKYKWQSAAMMLLVLLSAVSIWSAILIWQQQQITDNALQAETESSKEAKRQSKKAREAVNKMLTAVGDVRLRNIPQMDGVRTELLEEALAFNREFLTESNDPEDILETAHAQRRMGEIYFLLNRTDEALDAYQTSQELCETLMGLNSDHMEARALNAEIDLNVARQLISQNQQAEASKRLEKSIESYKELSERDPEDLAFRHGIAVGKQLSGRNLSLISQNSDAEKRYLEAISIFDWIIQRDSTSASHRFEQARTYLLIGGLYTRTNRRDLAITSLNTARSIYEALVHDFEHERVYQEGLADNLNQLAAIYLRSRDHDSALKAEALFRQVTNIYEKLATNFPQIANYRLSQAVTLNGKAIALAYQGEAERAGDEFNNAVEILDRLNTDFPAVPNFQFQHAHAIRRLGVHMLNTDSPEKAIAWISKAYDKMSALRSSFPQVTTYQLDEAELAFLIAQTIHRRDLSNKEGIDWSLKAVQSAERLAKNVSDQTLIRHKLAKYIRIHSQFLTRTEQLEDAEKELDRAIEIQRELVRDAPMEQEHHRHLAISLYQRCDLLIEGKEWKAAESAGLESLNIRLDSAGKNSMRNDHWIEAIVSHNQLGYLYKDQNKNAEARKQFQAGLDVSTKQMQQSPQEFRFRHQFLNSAKGMIQLEIDLNRKTEIQKLYEQASKLIENEQSRDRPNQSILELGKELQDVWDG